MEIYFKGQPLHLEKEPVRAGDAAPDFTAVGRDMAEVRFASFAEPVKVVTSFPSLDTPVCALQLKTFNRRATELSRAVRVVALSMDLPFAQERFCAANGIERVTVLSDYRHREFGRAWGLVIREWQLLARAVLIVKGGRVAYAQVCPEITGEPDYDEAMAKLAGLLK